jgi:nuclear receptor interaction protein
MADSLDVKLLRKQLGDKRRHTSVKTIYGDRSWISDLDIINELGGHTGCVNALRCVPASSPVMDIH